MVDILRSAFWGALLEYQTIDKALENQRVFDFVRLYLDTEVTPTLEKLADFDVEKYKSSLLKRFGNKHIEDQVSRICSQSSAKNTKVYSAGNSTSNSSKKVCNPGILNYSSLGTVQFGYDIRWS